MPSFRSSWLLLACACTAAPPVQDPAQALKLAEEWLQAGRAADAAWLLGCFANEDFEGAQLERYKARRGRALLDSGEPYDAWYVLRTFLDDHPFISPYYGDVETVWFEAGRTLIRSDWSFWIFGSDADEGEAILADFVKRFPRSRYQADALHMIGQKAFDDGDWESARNRYTDLRQHHPDSEWAALAEFRVAMSRFRSLRGPAYDLAEMRITRNELRGYLASNPENVEFRRQAADALAVVHEWIAKRHVMIADFYRRIGNPIGERNHLRSAVQEGEGTEAAQQARARLGDA